MSTPHQHQAGTLPANSEVLKPRGGFYQGIIERARRRPILCAFALLFVHGILLGLALPPWSWWPLSMVVMFPALLAGESLIGKSWWAAFLASLGLLPFWLFTHVWIINVTAPGYFPMCVMLSALTALQLWIYGQLRARLTWLPRPLAFAVAWVGVDAFRGEVAFTGYPWAFASHPLIEWWPLASPASVLGVYFVTFLLCLLAGCALGCLQTDPKSKHPSRYRAALAGVAAIWALCIFLIPSDKTSSTLRVGVIQTNVPQDVKLSWVIEQKVAEWEDFARMVSVLGESKPQIIVWPETMIPGITLETAALQALRENQIVFNRSDGGAPVPSWIFADDLFEMQRLLGVPMLVGDEAAEGLEVRTTSQGIEIDPAQSFNSVYVVEKGQPQARYDKIHLTPFGEIMPYIHHWPWLQKALIDLGAKGMEFNLSEGSSYEPLSVPLQKGGNVLVSTPICFESTDADLVRHLTFARGSRRASFISFVTNDGWFGNHDMIREQHAQAARWRCLELATPGVRAANTGRSMFIDAKGRELPLEVDTRPLQSRGEGVLVSTIELATQTPIFAYVGNLWAWVCMIAAPSLVIWGRLRKAPI